jgi:hypothetical protein
MVKTLRYIVNPKQKLRDFVAKKHLNFVQNLSETW